MKSRERSRFTLIVCAVVTLARCGGSQPPISGPGASNLRARIANGRFIPQWLSPASGALDLQARSGPGMVLRQIVRTDVKAQPGIYASQYQSDDVFGYQVNNLKNNPPTCEVSTGYAGVDDIAADVKGDLMITELDSTRVLVLRGPKMCGPELGSISDPYGPTDVASLDARHGTIIIGNLIDGGSNPAGSVSVCTLSGGCTLNLKNPAMFEVAGVALAKNGDCWASAQNESRTATLTYFKGCSGTGQEATGYQNSYLGGLDIDNFGNIVSINLTEVSVYSGCNPACTLVGGPFSLQGHATFGHVNHDSTLLATADNQFGQVDVYHYKPTKVTYWYSFSNGLNPSYILEGAAFTPRSREGPDR